MEAEALLAELQDERRKREEAEGLLEAKGAIVTELMADIARLREEESIRVAEQQMLVERLMESKATLEADVRGLHRDKEELERASASTPKSAMPPRTVAAGPSNCETEARAPIPRLCLAIGRGGRLGRFQPAGLSRRATFRRSCRWRLARGSSCTASANPANAKT